MVGRPAASEIPVVDVVGAEVLERAEIASDGTEVVGRCREGCSLEDEESGLGIYRTV